MFLSRCYPVELDNVCLDVDFSKISVPKQLNLNFLRKI